MCDIRLQSGYSFKGVTITHTHTLHTHTQSLMPIKKFRSFWGHSYTHTRVHVQLTPSTIHTLRKFYSRTGITQSDYWITRLSGRITSEQILKKGYFPPQPQGFIFHANCACFLFNFFMQTARVFYSIYTQRSNIYMRQSS